MTVIQKSIQEETLTFLMMIKRIFSYQILR